MKQLTRVLALLVALVVGSATSGCDWSDHGGEYTTQDRKVAAFDRIKINVGRADVTIKEGPQRELTLRGGEKTLDKTTTNVTSGTLSIDREGNASKSLKITIVVPKLRGVDVDGAGSVELVEVDTDALELRKGGAGELSATGKVDMLTATLSGVGELSLADLVAHRANVQVNGVGHAVVNVIDDLSATVNGVGGVEYHGNPAVHPNLNGVGSIRKA